MKRTLLKKNETNSLNKSLVWRAIQLPTRQDFTKRSQRLLHMGILSNINAKIISVGDRIQRMIAKDHWPSNECRWNL